MEEPTLRVGDSRSHERIVPEMHRCWGGKASIENYRKFHAEIDSHPWARRRIRTLTLQDSDGDCLSSLCLHTVRARHNSQTIQLGGIARVITPQYLRGRGYAGRLIRYAIAVTELQTLQLLKLILRSSEDGEAFDALFGSLRLEAEARGRTVRRTLSPWEMAETPSGTIRANRAVGGDLHGALVERAPR